MNRWRRSVEELQVKRRQLLECERAQEALSKVTACFQQLAMSLGSNSDGSFLREEMNDTRALAHRISTGLSRRLLSLLSECESSQSSPEEREHAERLWVLFLSALESFLQDLLKASDLIGQFPLTQRNDRRALVNTGSGDSVSGVAARAASVQTPWLTLEEEPSPNLTNHIIGLQALLGELQQKVSVAFWAVEATQQAWAEAASQDQEESLEDLMEVDIVSPDSQTACCHPPCCRVGCMLCLLTGLT